MIILISPSGRYSVAVHLNNADNDVFLSLTASLSLAYSTRHWEFGGFPSWPWDTREIRSLGQAQEIRNERIINGVFRLCCEAGLGDCTAQPGNGSVLRLRRGGRKNEFLIKNSPISANSVPLR